MFHVKHSTSLSADLNVRCGESCNAKESAMADEMTTEIDEKIAEASVATEETP